LLGWLSEDSPRLRPFTTRVSRGIRLRRATRMTPVDMLQVWPLLRETGQCMVSLQELRHERRAAIVDLARRHGARIIRVYGSVARGQANDSSDLDLLVEWEPDRSLLDVVGLKQDLEDLLGVTVDIGSERGLHWFIRDEVLREAVPL
jgi:uncharacterized protein